MSLSISRAAGAAVGTAVLLTSISVPAQQAAADPPCYSGEVCVYRHGVLQAKFPPVASGSCRFVGSSFDKVVNLSAWHQRAWSGTNCTGRNALVGPGGTGYVNYFWSMGGY